MRNFILLSVSLFSFAVSAAVVEPFAFFSFTNGTDGASAVGTVLNEVNPGVNDMTVTLASGASGKTTYDNCFLGSFVYSSAEGDARICGNHPKSVHLSSTSSSGQGGKFSIARASGEFSKCHGTTGFTFEMFFRILPSEKFNFSGYIIQSLAGYSGAPFRIYFSTATQIKCGIGSVTGKASGAATLPFSLKDGKWHHFAWVETAAKNMEIWIDYVRYINVAIPDSVTLSTTLYPLDIANQYLQGRFSCFRLTSRALTFQEFMRVTSRSETVAMSSDTLAFYPCNDGFQNDDASATIISSVNSPFLSPGQVEAYNSANVSVTYDTDAPGRYVFSGRSYGAAKIFENPASVHMTNSANGASASIDFQRLSSELSKYHEPGNTFEYFVKVDDAAMTVYEPVLISDAGYLLGSETNRFMLGVPYYGYGYQSTELACYSVTNNLDGFDTRDDHSWSENLNFDIGVWHHIAIVEKSKTIKLYIDYIQRGEIHFDDYFTYDSQDGENPNAVKDLILGNYIQHCKISCVRVMKRALEPDEFMWATDNDGSVRGCGKPMFMKLMAH